MSVRNSRCWMACEVQQEPLIVVSGPAYLGRYFLRAQMTQNGSTPRRLLRWSVAV